MMLQKLESLNQTNNSWKGIFACKIVWTKTYTLWHTGVSNDITTNKYVTEMWEWKRNRLVSAWLKWIETQKQWLLLREGFGGWRKVWLLSRVDRVVYTAAWSLGRLCPKTHCPAVQSLCFWATTGCPPVIYWIEPTQKTSKVCAALEAMLVPASHYHVSGLKQP